MMRRSLLALLGLPLVGDGLVRPQNAPVAQQPSVGVQPGTTSAIVRANTVIVFGPTGAPVGIFVYQTGTTPGPGNPPVISITQPGTTADPYGSPVKPGIYIADTNPARSDYIQLLPGSPPAINIGTGDAAQSTPAKVTSGVLGSGGTRRLAVELVAPTVTGGTGSAVVTVASQSADLTQPGFAEISYSDGVKSGGVDAQPGQVTVTASDAGGTATVVTSRTASTFGMPVTATAGTAASPTLITTDTAGGNTAANANGWTGTLKYKLLPFDAVQVNGILVPPAGVANPSNVNVALAAAYQPNSTQQLSAVEDPGVPHLGQSLICEMQVSGVIRVYDSTAGEAVRIFGTYALDF